MLQPKPIAAPRQFSPSSRDFLTENKTDILAFALTGRFRGGPAQAAVVASSMFGMVSGSTMTNVVSTGTFTIPLMIRTGFSRLFAGAVEAVASCGGQIAPPIMGASVFIMSEIIEVPYVYLMLYGLIPAFLYYFSLSTSIYFEARRLGMKRMDASEIPDAREQVQQGGYLLIPVLILLASIVSGETPGLAGYKAVVSLLVMVDMVRSLRLFRARWGNRCVYLAGAMILAAIFFAFGPISAPGVISQNVALPMWGEVPLHRLALVLLGVCFALVPGWRGLPIIFPIALGLARWKIPTELAWIGQVPYVGLLPPVALFCIAVYLIALPVFRAGETPEAKASARDLGRAVLKSLEAGAKNSLGLVAATSAIGLIVGLFGARRGRRAHIDSGHGDGGDVLVPGVFPGDDHLARHGHGAADHRRLFIVGDCGGALGHQSGRAAGGRALFYLLFRGHQFHHPAGGAGSLWRVRHIGRETRCRRDSPPAGWPSPPSSYPICSSTTPNSCCFKGRSGRWPTAWPSVAQALRFSRWRRWDSAERP